MKKFWKEFKAFISRGNSLDMAVGVIVGGAFSKIVTSLVNDIIMPLIAMAMGGKSMSGLCLVLNGESLYLADGSENPAALVWHYGNFIQTIIDFLIIALCVFLFVRLMMRASKLSKEAAERVTSLNKKAAVAAQAEAVEAPAAEAAQAAPAESVVSETDKLLTEIRDLMKERETEKGTGKA